MINELRPIKRQPSLSEYVRDSIREYIVENKLAPGSPIPSEKELSQRLGVGRNSVREAVKALELLGVLETRQGSGMYVRDFSLDSLIESLPYHALNALNQVIEFLEIRQILELGALSEVLDKITSEQIEALSQVLDRMRELSERGESYPEIDREFHHLLFEPVGNATLLRLLDAFWLLDARMAKAPDGDDALQRQICEEHAAMAAAVQARDADAARETIQRHYAAARGRVLKSRARIREN